MEVKFTASRGSLKLIFAIHLKCRNVTGLEDSKRITHLVYEEKREFLPTKFFSPDDMLISSSRTPTLTLVATTTIILDTIELAHELLLQSN